MKTLGEFLTRSTEKDSNIAAEFYNPGFDPDSDERNATAELQPGQHDLAVTARRKLGEWATRDIGNPVYAISPNSPYLNEFSGEVESTFELTSQNNSSLGNFLTRIDFGRSISNVLGVPSKGFVTGHNLLKGRVRSDSFFGKKLSAYPDPANPDDLSINSVIQQSLESTNLHAPGRAYLSEPGSEMEDGTIRDGLYSLQNGSFGEFDPQRRRMEVDDLKRAVEATLENARGIVSDDGGIIDSLLNFAAPTIAPLQGIYDVRISKIQAIKDKFGEVEGQDEIARVREDFDPGDLFTKGGGITYGILNTPSQVFDGPPNGMIMTAFAGMLVLRGLIEVYGRFAHLLVSSSAKEPEGFWQLLPASVKRAANELGLNQGESALFEIGNEIGLNRTNLILNAGIKLNFADNWLDSETIIDNAKKGLDIFYGYKNVRGEFGIPIIGVQIASLLDYKSVFESPGFYANVTRIVLRDAQIITQFTQQNAGSSSSTGIPNAINSLATLAENLLTAPSFKLVINFAKLGILDKTDQITNKLLDTKDLQVLQLNANTNTQQQIETNVNSKLSKLFNDETEIDVLTNRFGYSHLKYGDLKFSPISNRYFVSLIKEQTNLKSNISDFYRKDVQKTPRLKIEEVEEVERIIDADYVPFSIQDLRTNEIISLPSFIESVNDSFNVSYESTHGYGRTDPVHSYSKTERNINLSFVIVALSIEDHQNVYNIVNKLTSMCYPQRSVGTKRRIGNIEFTQPLSQVPTASPLIRIRLGDLLRNNRTSDMFSRMFNDEIKKTEDMQQKIQNNTITNDLSRKWSLGELKVGDKIKFNTIPFVRIFKNKDQDYWDIEEPSNAVPPAQNFIYEFEIFDIIQSFASSYKTIEENNLVFTAEEENDPIASTFIKNYKTGKESVYSARAYNFLAKNKGKPGYILKFNGNSYFGFKRDGGKLAQYMEMLPVETAQAPVETEQADFYSRESNAIVRSFRSTSGRGMAGFIKDLQLDYSGFNWGVDRKFKAPMGVKVSITFAPIHDAMLGLDHNGTMISPSHPVGFDYV